MEFIAAGSLGDRGVDVLHQYRPRPVWTRIALGFFRILIAGLCAGGTFI